MFQIMQNAQVLKNNFINYKKFDQLDGSHPLKKILPKGFIDYSARYRKGGSVRYFNFELAAEMGLIDGQSPYQMSKELEAKILETFSIQIINEFDQMKNRKFPDSEMKTGKYMATRYLQLQHDDKKGRTSGDGRSIWNGQIKNKGKVWDISSGGTGGTRLSPATSKFNKFFETGDPSISYGCGYAEIDEGLATAIMSKALARNNYSTEESLAIIEFKNNISINIRAHRCLIRPSHFFLYLKQNRLEELKNLADYYIESQSSQSDWKDCPKGKKKYKFLLNRFAADFAKTTARFEDDYIFCWLDWDGDNILMDGGIIDYGSVRQFGIYHHEYRYDDVERFSTNIPEQKQKARYMVKTFAQLIDYIESGDKKPLSAFDNHKVLSLFDEVFETQKKKDLLHKMGFNSKKIKYLLSKSGKHVEEFLKQFSFFEKVKSVQGIIKISDGVNCDVIFNMRQGLKELPGVYLLNDLKPLAPEDFLDIIKSGFISASELELTSSRKNKIQKFQKSYLKLVKDCAQIFQMEELDILQEMTYRSSVINKSDRITGDSVTFIIEYILKNRKQFDPENLYGFLNSIEKSQNLDPDFKVERKEINTNKHFRKAMEIIVENREGI